MVCLYSCSRCGVGDGGGMTVANAGHVGSTRGSGIVSSAPDVLWMRSWWSV